MTKLFSHPKTWEENPILKNLSENVPISDKKTQKSCDDVFYEYLQSFKDKTNEKYFILSNYYNIKQLIKLFNKFIN